MRRDDGLLRDTDGVAYTEYIVLTVSVSVGVSAALAALGVPLLNLFHYVNLMILLPIP